jgi:hypothetical protein
MLTSFLTATTKDDKVEIFSTMLGAFILGSSFAKEFFVDGRFEARIFLLGLSCFVLFFLVTWIAGVRPVLFNRQKQLISSLWLAFFFVGCGAAIDLFAFQYLAHKSADDVRLEIIVFLACYALATNLLYSINRSVLLLSISQKTISKYLLAPINGLSAGVVLTGFFIWLLGT